jgi:hypothetical protein
MLNRDKNKDAAYALIIEQQQQELSNALQIEQTGYTLEQVEQMEAQYYYNQITSI